MNTDLLSQLDVFYEEDKEHLAAAANYFNVKTLNDYDAVFKEIRHDGPFRGSIQAALRLKRRFDFCNCLNWMPVLRKSIFNNQYTFLDLNSVIERWEDKFQGSYESLFVRPVSPYKEFSGGEFTLESLKSEREFLRQSKNIGGEILCVVHPIKNIKREYRCIFIDGILIDMSLYLKSDEIVFEREWRDDVAYEAGRIRDNDYFLNKFNFVLDFAIHFEKPYLLEINGFETSSFYACDPELIYKNWKKSCE